MANEMTVRDRLRMVVTKAGGPSEFSRKSGIARSTLDTYINGNADIKAERLASICGLFDVNGHWLLTGAGEPDVGPVGLQQAIQALTAMGQKLGSEPDADQRKLLAAWVQADPAMREVFMATARAVLKA